MPAPPPDAGRWSIGTVGVARSSHVDADGTVAVHRGDGLLRLRWAAGDGDRWHRPEGSPTTRRRRLGGGVPVVETAVRAGSGDVRCVAYGARVPGDAIVVVLENATAGPLVLDVVLDRPDLTWRESDRVVTGAPGDVVMAPSVAPGEVRSTSTASTVAIPFVHGTTVRLLLPTDGSIDFRAPP